MMVKYVSRDEKSFICTQERPEADRLMLLQGVIDRDEVEVAGRRYRLYGAKTFRTSDEIECFVEDLGPVQTVWIDC